MQHAFLTVDLGFGDAGKGSIVDFLTRQQDAHTVIRYNGGAQAGHRVVLPHPSPLTPQKKVGEAMGEEQLQDNAHVFAQFGSGTLAGADTHLSRFMLLDPLAMMKEEKHLRILGVSDAFSRTTIDERALVITPFQRAVNRLRELARGNQRHGSCGMGIGETMTDALMVGEQALRAGDLSDLDRLHGKLTLLRALNQNKIRDLQDTLPETEQVVKELEILGAPDWADWLLEAYQDFTDQAQIVDSTYLRSILQRDGSVVFEGAQGVLLDEWLGFHPHTTWSTTTLANADTLLHEAGYAGEVTRVGITRSYATRHGAGPFVSEERAISPLLPDAANTHGDWQQGFRVGWLDLVMLRYACEMVGKLDFLAVTCLDRLTKLPELKVCPRYLYDTFTVERIVPSLQPHDLEYQSRITQNLTCCKPLFESVADVDSLLAKIEKTLNLPVRIVSYGPTANEKYWVA
ncbi:MAG: adenylosuccinate synthetase [Caldilineaceae bacterium]